MKIPQAFQEILDAHLPAEAVSYCAALWLATPFSLHVLRPRSTKLGDFRYRQDKSIQTITINQDLNPYQFLLTLIHEIAHLRTFEMLGPRHPPHGNAWKSTFKQLMAPLLVPAIFPIDLLVPLKRHMAHPSASSARDLFLMKEMSKYDTKSHDSPFLSDLPTGSIFSIGGRTFRKGETRRSRVVCEEINTSKKYLISRIARVKPV